MKSEIEVLPLYEREEAEAHAWGEWVGGAALEYRLVLKTDAFATVKEWDDVTSSTGAVTQADLDALDAADISFTTGTGTSWFDGSNVADALDNIITKVDTVAGTGVAASGVSVTDTGAYYVSTNVETVLAEIGGRGLIPTQATHSGKFLKTDGSALSWDTAGSPTGSLATTGSATFPGGLIFKWGKTANIVTDTADNVVTFATPFPTAIFQVLVSCATGYAVGGSTEAFSVGAHGYSVNGFLLDNDATDQAVSWFAIGN